MEMTIAELLAAGKKALDAKAAAQAASVQASVSETAQGGKEGDAAAAEAARVAAETGKDGKEVKVDTAKEGTTEADPKVEGARTETSVAAAPDLSALVTRVTELSIETAKVSAQRDELMASCASLCAIVGDSLSRMSIALGGGKVDVSAMTPAALVAQHTATAAQFAAKFPTNGIAAVQGAGNEDGQKKVGIDPLHAQRMAAVMGNRKKD